MDNPCLDRLATLSARSGRPQSRAASGPARSAHPERWLFDAGFADGCNGRSSPGKAKSQPSGLVHWTQLSWPPCCQRGSVTTTAPMLGLKGRWGIDSLGDSTSLLSTQAKRTQGIQINFSLRCGRGEPAAVPPRPRQAGSVEVRSHIWIAPGIELQVAPEQAQISPEQVRALALAVLTAWNRIKEDNNENESPALISAQGDNLVLRSVHAQGRHL